MDPILSRRSIRRYTNQPLSDEELTKLLTAAMVAPSAGDERPWHFVVVRDLETRRRVSEFHPYCRMLTEAALGILVCGDERLEKHRGYWVQDCSAATENILIEAVQLGLGAVWLGIYPIAERVEGCRRLMKIPEQVTPFALIAVGHAAEHKPPADRYDESRVHHDLW